MMIQTVTYLMTIHLKVFNKNSINKSLDIIYYHLNDKINCIFSMFKINPELLILCNKYNKSNITFHNY